MDDRPPSPSDMNEIPDSFRRPWRHLHLVTEDIVRLPLDGELAPGTTCDWGNCDKPARFFRLSPTRGWLPVCSKCVVLPRTST